MTVMPKEHWRRCLLFGIAPNLDAALLGRTIVGLGVSVTFIAMLKIIAVSFEESRFAPLVGACMVVGNLGSVVAGVPLTLLAQHSGWPARCGCSG